MKHLESPSSHYDFTERLLRPAMMIMDTFLPSSYLLYLCGFSIWGLGTYCALFKVHRLTGMSIFLNRAAHRWHGNPRHTTQFRQRLSWLGRDFWVFFPILMYTSLYLTVVQESFNLIAILPDKVLRWVGAAAESIGAESAKWAEQSKGKMEEGGKESLKASGAANKYLEEKLQGMAKKVAQGGPSAAG